MVFLDGGTLPIGGVDSGRVCACSLRSRLVVLGNQPLCNDNCQLFKMKYPWFLLPDPLFSNVSILYILGFGSFSLCLSNGKMTAGAGSTTYFHIHLYCPGEDLWEENIFTPYVIADLARGLEHWAPFFFFFQIMVVVVEEDFILQFLSRIYK